MRLSAALACVLILATLAAAANRYGLRDMVPRPAEWTYRAVRVAGAVDGDTLKLADGTNVRILGANSPELSHPGLGIDEEPGGKEARAWTQDRLAGKMIRLYSHDTYTLDRYGRTLGLVFYWGGGSFNLDLIENGHAKPAFLFLKPDLNDALYEEVYARAQAPATGLVNVNTASVVELDAVNGISRRMAEEIVTMRTANGPFANLAALDAVKGVGPATLARIGPYLTF